MNRITRIVGILVFLLAAQDLCAQARTIGKIEAKLNGEPKTWYLLYRDDQAEHSALWLAHGKDRKMAVLGGYESRDVEFGKDAHGNPKVSAPGSMLTINFWFPDGAKSVTQRLPQPGTSQFSLVLLPKVGDFSNMMSMQEGVLEVSDIEFSGDGQGTFKGTFSGTLKGRGENGGQMTITDGRFEVTGAREMAHP